jgi:uncharacterized protein (DUF58 family)
MIPLELIKKIRRIQIRTSRIVDEMLAGQYHSAFKGRGIEFEEVRPYQVGDDIRAIDWNVTARVGEPYIKRFREERELAVRLLVDLSASQTLGTNLQTKRDLVAELSASLAFAAIKNNDMVGLTLFTDGIEKSIPPRKGSRHGLRLIREILFTQAVGHGTDIGMAIEHLARTAKRRSVVFLISDFQDIGYEKPLKVAARGHDIIPVVVMDRREFSMPNVGLIRLRDSETGEVVVMDTASGRHRRMYEEHAREIAQRRDRLFQKLKLETIRLSTGEDFVEPLRVFFRYRERAKSG